MKQVHYSKLLSLVLIILLCKMFGIPQELASQPQYKLFFLKSKQNKIGCTEIKLIYSNEDLAGVAEQIFPKYQAAIEYAQQITGEDKLKTSRLFLSPSNQITYSLLLDGNKFVITKPFPKSDLEKTIYFDLMEEMGNELVTRFTDSYFLKKGFSQYLAWKSAKNFANQSNFGEKELLVGELLLNSAVVFPNIKTFKENNEINDFIKASSRLKQLNLSSAVAKASFYLFVRLMSKMENKSKNEEIKSLIARIKDFYSKSGKMLETNDFKRIIKNEYGFEFFEKPAISKERVVQLFEHLLNKSTSLDDLRLVVTFVEIPNKADILKKLIPFALQLTGNLPFAVALSKKRSTVEFNQAIKEFLAESDNKKYTKKRILKMIDEAVKIQRKFETAN